MKTIITAILSLLPLLAAAALLAWFLPVRVTLFIVIVLQMLMLAAQSNRLSRRRPAADNEQKV